MTDKTEAKELMLADISFRDYLAAEAMNAMITTAATPVLTSMAELENHIAKTAYVMADAMLKARGDYGI
ncbi:TPA: hypothetical protein SMS04_002718 [Proteus mirabilis]|nr:hypothetical protein [Proteus mirabilis]